MLRQEGKTHIDDIKIIKIGPDKIKNTTCPYIHICLPLYQFKSIPSGSSAMENGSENITGLGTPHRPTAG